MAQQTAVEWLQERYNRRQVYEESIFDEEFEQAKAMEKEQIKFAYNDGAENIVAGKYKAMEDYYNETYSDGKKN
jgi:hypothetical protein